MSTSHEHWDDPRITAYVMDELTPTDTAQFETEMQQHPQLANAVDEARRVTEKLAGFYAAMPTSKLDEVRRERITGAAVTPLKGSSADLGYSGRRIVMWVVAASVLILAVAIPLWQTRDTRIASHAFSERAPSQVRDITESQSDLVPPTPVRPDVEARVNSMLDVADDRENIEAPQSRSATEENSPFADSSPMMRSPRARDLSAPPPSAPEPAVAPTRGSVAKKRARRESRADEMGMESMSGEIDSDMIGSDEAMMGAGFGMMGMDAGISGEAMPQKTLSRSATMEPAAGMAAKPTDLGVGPGSPGDKFSPLGENGFLRVAEHPLSTFSIDVDTASYAKVRSYLQNNQLPRPDAVRIEELVNYFDYDYAGPTVIEGEPVDPFSAAMSAAICPWNPEHRLVRVGLQAKQLTEQDRPQCSLVFLIDTSGSMSEANKLPLVIEGLQVLLDELRPDDRIAIVVYAGSAGLVLDSTPVEARPQILRALTQLQSGGSTNGGAGLQLAYDTAREHFFKNGVNRVILCSDGDFNVGMTGTDALLSEIKKQAKSGVDLTVLGFGMGNHNDAMMEAISNNAEGNYAFIDTIAEARKVLADQLTGTLVTVAKDVKIQIEFNPAVVSAYRLIGYENRLLDKEDFNDDTKDAGDIGAGHQVTALYEVVPIGVEVDAIAPPVSALKYQARAATQAVSAPVADDAAEIDNAKPTSTEMLTLNLRYKQPQGTESKLMTRVLDDSQTPFDQVDGDFRFAASVAAFGMQLRKSPFAGSWTYNDVLRVAEGSIGSDPHGLRSEFVGLVKIAKTLVVSE